MKIFTYLPVYKFSVSSLFAKVPKSVQVEQQTGFLAKLFSNTKNAPSYILLKELFQYLQNSEMLQREFPFIKSDPRFEENWMLVHALLLRNRFKLEQSQLHTISIAEVEKFNYNIQTYFFSQFGEYLNPHMPVRNFAQHFSEVYFKKLQLFEEVYLENEQASKSIRQKGSNEPLSIYGRLLRQIVYEDRVRLGDNELMKLCKYYAAHRKYLEALEWGEMLEYKVKWGFEGDVRLIEEF